MYLIMKLIGNILFFIATCSQLQGQSFEWPIFRGKPDLSGRSEFELPLVPELKWSISTGSSTKSSPVLNDGTIFFGNSRGTLFAVSTDGSIKWKFETGNAIEAPPLVYSDKVFIGASDGVLRAVNKMTGKLIWSYKTDNQIVGSANIWISAKRTSIVFGSYDYFLYSIDPGSGKLLWKVETNNYINGTPAVAIDRIVFGGCDGMIRIADPVTGKEKAIVDIGVYIAASPALLDERAYFGDYDGTLYCLDMLSKKVTWKMSLSDGSGAILAIPAVGSNSVVVGSEDKYIYNYDAKTGMLKWKYRTNDRIAGSAVITNTKVLFGSTDGSINMLGLTDGKKLWSFNAGSPVSSSPAVTRDRFYFLTEDGRLLSFGSATKK
jgi:outer membrane protein assembly factor BamB